MTRAGVSSTQSLGFITQHLGYQAASRGAWVAVLEAIFGNASGEKILLYLEQYEEGYATAIARTFDDVSLNMAQRQLDRFEASRSAGQLAQGPHPALHLEPPLPVPQRAPSPAEAGAGPATRRRAQALLRRASTAATRWQASLSSPPGIDERMPLEHVAALVCSTLDSHGISVVLSGGSVISSRDRLTSSPGVA